MDLDTINYVNMKVALVTNFPIYSGTGKVPYKYWQYFRRFGLAKADLFLPYFLKESDKNLPENQNVKVLQPFLYNQAPTVSRALLYFVYPHLLPKGYDVYHFGNHMLGRFARFRRPSVVTVHDVLQFYYPETQFGQGLAGKIYNHFMAESVRSLSQADHLICVSEWSKKEVVKFFPRFPEEKITVVYNGLDHDLFYPRDRIESRRRLSLPQDKKILLHLGSEIERKQVPLILKFLLRLKNEYPDLILLRHGERTENSRKLIDELGLNGSVVYINYSPEENLPLIYSAADLLLQPSSEEGFCFPVVEAMACGLPVLASNRASLPEVGGQAEAGIIDELSVECLAQKAKSFLNLSGADVERIRQRGILNAQRFNWVKTAEQVLAVYNRV